MNTKAELYNVYGPVHAGTHERCQQKMFYINEEFIRSLVYFSSRCLDKTNVFDFWVVKPYKMT